MGRSSRSGSPVMYVWNEKTLLWELKEGLPKVNRVIHSLLVPTLRKKIDDAYKAIDAVTLEYQFVDQEKKNELTTCFLEAREALKKAEKKVKSLGSAGKLQSIFKVCGDCVGTESEFNQKLIDENLLPIKKNVINLETLKIRPRTKEDMFNFSLNVDFTEDTKDAEDFLREYCPKDDEDTLKYLMDCLSYMIAGGLNLKKFLIFWGPSGDNGKSALMKIIEYILGDLYTSVSEDLFTEKTTSAGAATPALTQCINKFVGVYGETKKALLNENTIKMMTGDDTITYRRLYGEAQKVRLFMTLVLVGNYKPNWSHNNPMANRIAFFPFMNHFVSKPTKPNDRKKDEKRVKYFLGGVGRNQFFSMLVKNAASLYKRRKFHHSLFVAAAFKDYLCEVDTTSQFIETSIIRQSKGGMTIGQILSLIHI